MAKYEVTPARGRVGKARQVAPVVVEYTGLPGDLQKLAVAHTNALRKHTHKKINIASSIAVVAHEPYQLQGILYHTHTGEHLAVTTIEPLEE